MRLVTPIKPFTLQELFEVLGDLDIVQIGEGDMRVAFHADVRKQNQLRVSAVSIHRVDELLGPGAGNTPEIDVEDSAGVLGNVVAVYNEDRHLRQLLEFFQRNWLGLHRLVDK